MTCKMRIANWAFQKHQGSGLPLAILIQRSSWEGSGIGWGGCYKKRKAQDDRVLPDGTVIGAGS